MPYHNPILPGFHPDPSICRVGEDYYLATSSFEYFPGVPIFHSRDLVHWRPIGHAITRESQLDLRNAASSCGLFAPTLRHHAGRFFLTTTDVFGGQGHFYVATNDPAGEWSEPIFQPGDGFDPDLFFDEDGSAWFSYKGWDKPGIYLRRIDIATGIALSQDICIWTGQEDAHCEGPHLYRINDYYYLLVAEGGTNRGHMVVAARSETISGSYIGCPHNPILTHRHRALHPIQATGHGDLVQAHDGSWWLVFLGIRQTRNYGASHHLGRETFLAPVTWTADGWPVVNGGEAIELAMETAALPLHPWPLPPVRDDFDAPALGLCWNHRRNPERANYSLTERPGYLMLHGSTLALDNPLGSPTFVGRRQQHVACRAATLVDFEPACDTDEAGLVVLANESHHYEIAVTRRNNARCVIVRRRIGDLVGIVAHAELADGPVTLQITGNAQQYAFSYRQGGDTVNILATGATHHLSSEVAGTFTGVYLGLYATGHGQACGAPAWFDWFDYQPLSGEEQ